MTSKRIGLLTGSLLAGALLLGTAGLVVAQDPTPSPTPTPWTVAPGGMMGGGMMGGGMMGGQGAGMMGGMSGDQLEWMDQHHDRMVEDGSCDPADMQEFHVQVRRGN